MSDGSGGLAYDHQNPFGKHDWHKQQIAPISILSHGFIWVLMILAASLGLSTTMKTIPKNLSFRSPFSISLIYSSTSFSSFLASSMLIGSFAHIFPGIFLFGNPLGCFFSSHSALYLSSLYSGSLSSSESFYFSVFLDSI